MLSPMTMGKPVKAGDVAPDRVEGRILRDHGMAVALLTLDDDRRVVSAEFVEPGAMVPDGLSGAIPMLCADRVLFDPLPDNLFLDEIDSRGNGMFVRRHDLTHGAV